MKRSFYRYLLFLLPSAFALVCLAGCQSGKPVEEENKGMSAQQKAIIAEHKKQTDQ